MKKALIVLATVLYIFALITFSKILSADTNYVKARELLSKAKIEKSLIKLNSAINKVPNEPRYYYEKTKVLIALNQNEEALTYLKKAEELNPNNLVTLRNMIPIYSLVSKKEAQNFYQKLKQKYPNDAGLLIQIAKQEKQLGLADNYKKTIEMIENLRPGLTDWAL